MTKPNRIPVNLASGRNISNADFLDGVNPDDWAAESCHASTAIFSVKTRRAGPGPITPTAQRPARPSPKEVPKKRTAEIGKYQNARCVS